MVSLTGVVWTCFLCYVAYTSYSISTLLTLPSCEGGDVCLQPYLATKRPKLQLYVYTSVVASPSRLDDLTLVHYDPAFSPISPEGGRDITVAITLPGSVRLRNGTMTLHVFMSAGGARIKSWPKLLSNNISYSQSELVLHYTAPPTTYSLLGDKQNSTQTTTSTTPPPPPQRPSAHLRSVVPLCLMTDHRALPLHRLPVELVRLVRPVAPQHYLPPLHMSRMAQRLEHLVPVAGSKRQAANFTLRYTETGWPKMRLLIQFEAALESLAGLGFSPKDVDDVKGIFDTNLYLLGITFFVALLHLVFDVLAFKNDISFWRGRESLVGLSGGVVLWRAVAQVIIFLHLLEEDTSLLVLGPAGVAVFIEIWKVTKAYRVRYRKSVDVAGSDHQKAEDDRTRAIDSEAFRYLGYLLVPLCAVGAVWSLLYVPHKSWYSWLVSSLVNGVYGLGFLFMLPQLFINYRLKSVAHLPWRAFSYKAFNTFIDDLFAFIIKMPTSHRIACFRDDIVFIVYLYQRWLYPVDVKRPNEYGMTGSAQQQQPGKKHKSKRD